MRLIPILLALASCNAPIAQYVQLDEKAVINGVRSFLGGRIEDHLTTKVSIAMVDLNDDGTDEAIAHVIGESTCGSGGCITFILRKSDNGYRQVARLTISRPPVKVFDAKSNGWHDLSVWVQGGGIQPGYNARLRFDGNTYPSNPSLVRREQEEPASSKVAISRSSPTILLYE